MKLSSSSSSLPRCSEPFARFAVHQALHETKIETNNWVMKETFIDPNLHALVRKSFMAHLLPMLDYQASSSHLRNDLVPAVAKKSKRSRKVVVL